MDMSVTAAATGVMQMQQARANQDAQVNMIKMSQDMEKVQAANLLQTLPGSLPLASEGTLGTQLNVMA